MAELAHDLIWREEVQEYLDELEERRLRDAEQRLDTTDDAVLTLPGADKRAARRKIMRGIIDSLRPKDEELAHSTSWYQGRHRRGSKTKRIEMVVEPSADNPRIPIIVDVEVKPGRQLSLLKPKPRIDEIRAAEALALDTEEVTTRETYDGVYHFSGKPYPEQPEGSDVLMEGYGELVPTITIEDEHLTLAQTALFAAASEIDPSAQHADMLSPVVAAGGVHVANLASWREDNRRQQDISELLTQF